MDGLFELTRDWFVHLWSTRLGDWRAVDVIGLWIILLVAQWLGRLVLGWIKAGPSKGPKAEQAQTRTRAPGTRAQRRKEPWIGGGH